jgi:hypothetical protein
MIPVLAIAVAKIAHQQARTGAYGRADQRSLGAAGNAANGCAGCGSDANILFGCGATAQSNYRHQGKSYLSHKRIPLILLILNRPSRRLYIMRPWNLPSAP